MQDKQSLRNELLRKRDSIPLEVRRTKNRLIEERLFSLGDFRRAGVVFFFASFRSEIETTGMIKQSLTGGKRVLLPKVDKARLMLLLYEVKGIEELTPGYMGIPEPSMTSEERLMDINDADAVIIPGAGFDLSGNRIGYGGGYYDRLLSGLKKEIPVIAPAYEEQIVESIPSEPHDIKVTLIVTDRRVIQPMRNL